MSEAIQTALQTLLKTLTELADVGGKQRVTRADAGVLDMGTAYAAIIWPGQVQSGDASGYQVTRLWDIPFDVFVRYTDDAKTCGDLTKLMDKLVNLLDTHPTLNGQPNITLDELATTADPFEVKDKQNNGPFFLMQSLRLQITERVALTGGEYT